MTDGLPRIFLLPGIGGDEPPLRDLRTALADRVTFKLLDYPDIDRPSSEIRNFDGIVGRVAELINVNRPSGDVHLAGYSFGGQIAFAVACKLQEEGRRIRLLALLDSRALSLNLPDSGPRVSNLDDEMSPSLAAADAASRLLIASGLSDLVRAAIRPTGAILGQRPAQTIRRLLLQNLRGRSLSAFKPGHFNGPVILFRAREQLVTGLPNDLGWSAHCTNVREVELHGGHNNLFRGDHLATNAELIWSEIETRLR